MDENEKPEGTRPAGAVNCWVEEGDSSVKLKVTALSDDPVELTSDEARVLGKTLLKLAKRAKDPQNDRMFGLAVRESRQEWEKTRSLGRRRFIWRQATYLAAMSAVAAYIKEFVSGRYHLAMLLAIPTMALFPGYFLGVLRWKNNEEIFLTGRREIID